MTADLTPKEQRESVARFRFLRMRYARMCGRIVAGFAIGDERAQRLAENRLTDWLEHVAWHGVGEC